MRNDNRHSRGGRPKKPTEECRLFSVTVKFTAAELATLKEAELKSGIPRASLIREFALKGNVRPRVTPEEVDLLKQLVQQLRGLGGNLNTIAKNLLIGNSPADPNQTADCIRNLREIINSYKQKLV